MTSFLKILYQLFTVLMIFLRHLRHLRVRLREAVEKYVLQKCMTMRILIVFNRKVYLFDVRISLVTVTIKLQRL